MAKADADASIRLDLNNPVFQENLLSLQKTERHAALDTLNKIRQIAPITGKPQGLFRATKDLRP